MTVENFVNSGVDKDSLMKGDVTPQSVSARVLSRSLRVHILGALSCILYVLMALLSRRFALSAPEGPRPVGAFLCLYFALFGVYLIAVLVVVRSPCKLGLIKTIWIYGLLFRVIFVPSVPILEIDIYRYLWDGASCRIGVDPYRHSPQEVELATIDESTSNEMQRLVELRDSTPAQREILKRVHFEHLTTIYPPVSQAVFAASNVTTPKSANVTQHVLIMKLWLTLFDIGTFALVIGILRELGRPMSWAILYGWCPLVLKEIAGSGHLDSIAIFFTTFAVYALIRFSRLSKSRSFGPAVQIWLALTIIGFALAVGAKIYPLVIAPVFLAVVVRSIGWVRGVSAGLMSLTLAMAMLYPMLKHSLPIGESDSASPSTTNSDESDGLVDTPPQLLPVESKSRPESSSGLTAFVSGWEMNDLVFMVTMENQRPDNPQVQGNAPWFVFIPNDVRTSLYDDTTRQDAIKIHGIAFQRTRWLTSIAMFLFGVWILVRQLKNDDLEASVRAVFYLLALFWILSPTQNPWYWMWAVPFLFTMTNRGWWLTSGVVGAYYFRFWLIDQFDDDEILFGAYSQRETFHFIVAPIEHTVWMTAVAIGWFRCKKNKSTRE